MNVNVSDLTLLQPAIFLAIEFPKHIERGIVDESTLSSKAVEKEVDEVEATRENACSGLAMWECQPNGMEGITLFTH